MPTPSNVVQLHEFRQVSRQEIIDDISSEAFMLLREAARSHGLPTKQVLIEHMRDIAVIISSVDGPETLAEVLDSIKRQIKGD